MVIDFVALMVLLVALFPSVSIKSLSIESLGKISLTHSLSVVTVRILFDC